MTLFVLGAGSFGVALAVGLLIRNGRRRQLALAFVGLVPCSALAIYSVVDCGEGFDCSAGVVFAGTLAAVWLAGVGSAALVRYDGRRPGLRTLAAAVVALLVVGASAAVASNPDHIFRWGCPTSAELDRAWSVDEVVEAFEEAGLSLEPASVPSMLPRPSGARAYRGARAFRHAAAHATLYVVVCRVQCSLFFPRRRGPERGERGRFSGEARPNVVAVITDDGDRRASERLRRALDEPLGQLDRTVDHGSRCAGR